MITKYLFLVPITLLLNQNIFALAPVAMYAFVNKNTDKTDEVGQSVLASIWSKISNVTVQQKVKKDFADKFDGKNIETFLPKGGGVSKEELEKASESFKKAFEEAKSEEAKIEIFGKLFSEPGMSGRLALDAMKKKANSDPKLKTVFESAKQSAIKAIENAK